VSKSCVTQNTTPHATLRQSVRLATSRLAELLECRLNLALSMSIAKDMAQSLDGPHQHCYSDPAQLQRRMQPKVPGHGESFAGTPDVKGGIVCVRRSAPGSLSKNRTVVLFRSVLPLALDAVQVLDSTYAIPPKLIRLGPAASLT
jgi:hypothetical protein